MSFSRFSRAVLPCVTGLFMASAAQAEIVVPDSHRSVGYDRNGGVMMAVMPDKSGHGFSGVLEYGDPRAEYWGCQTIYEVNLAIMKLVLRDGYSAIIDSEESLDVDRAVLVGIHECVATGYAFH